MRHINTFRFLLFIVALSLASLNFSCKLFQRNNQNSSGNTNASTPKQEQREEVKEPEKYQATLTVYLDKGDDAISITTPLLILKAARDGLSRRYQFNFNNQEVIYVEGKDNFHFLAVPECKQYLDVRLEQMGFRIPSSVTPQEIVEAIQKQNVFEPLGEETLKGRPVIKYRYTDLKTGEHYVFVDKETKMPVRAKIAAEVLDPKTPIDDTTGERRVLRLIVDVNNVVLNVEPSLFQVPQGLERATPKKLEDFCPKVREQVMTAVKTLWDLSANNNASANAK